ncbi:VOC family protein [Geomesophilobacter sediminis]|uniref:VOC family protein n=1 Tax=Geomesophilobacter sediminis TaxID=2798584 RepID=A0A8J7J7G2_9BACT|nr:VOC family protein [Geomesophilobacter sediminis]MBJ6725156.1 VOC family protein [Geomesophilobacter sediminis]
MQVTPYLNFAGRCEEAVEFYRKALGAEVIMLSRFKDIPEPREPGIIPPEAEEKIMHLRLKVGESTLLASDGRGEGEPNFHGFSLTITAASEAEAQRLFAALSEGGHIQMPLGKTFFSPSFGMIADRFGLSWMVYVAP